MRTLTFVLSLAAAAGLSAQVQQLDVTAYGKPFATFHYGADANKPFLAPIYSASGKIMTRGYPMENIPGESRDHLHHRGLWFSYDDVNGVKFWENDPSYTKPISATTRVETTRSGGIKATTDILSVNRGRIGKIVVQHAELKPGKRSSTLTAKMEWRDPSGKVLLVEDRDMIFYPDPQLRTIDFIITLTAAEDVTFGDTKEGAFAIRLNDAMTEKKGLKILDADGRTRMVNVWGKRSNWVDYSGEIDGEKLGVAMFDHPSNPRHPTYWHARDYGLFALNPFGQHAFDPKLAEAQLKLPAGQKLTFRWRVVFHPGDAESTHIADLYNQWASH